MGRMKRCPRCDGFTYIDRLVGTAERVCLMCGWRENTPPQEPAERPREDSYKRRTFKRYPRAGEEEIRAIECERHGQHYLGPVYR